MKSRTARSRWLRTFVFALVAAATGAGGLAAAAPLAWASPALAGTAAPRAHVAAAPAHAASTTRGHATTTPSRTLRVSSLNDSGHGTLRWALRTAGNAAPGISTVIDFTVAGQITLLSALPPVNADVWINGESAPGYAPGGPPVIGIDFGGHQGLTFASAARGGKLLGVAIENAGGNGVTVDARSVTLNANYIGLGLTGAKAGNHGNGIVVSAWSSGDRIGLNPSGTPGVVGNVISGNWGSGIVLAGSSHDTIVANRIGTNPAGTSGIGNRGNGIVVTAGGRGNELGGTEYTDPETGAQNNPTGSKGTVPPVFVVPPLGNLVSANGGNGVLISRGATGTMLNGNFIGTTASGDGNLGNAGNGVWIDRASRTSLTGCKFANNPFVYYNVVSGNGQNGIRITDSADAVVQGNFFGVGANNTTPIGNRLNGILVDGSSANTQVGGVIPLGNVSAGNGQNGVEVAGRAHGFVTFNTFGGLLAFKGAAPNGNDGLLVTSTGGDNLARTNVFSGNQRNGIELSGNASGVTVDPNIAGLTTSGQSPLPNGGDGLLIDGNAHSNVIGGTRRSVIAQNTFSGNTGYGVVITGRAHYNRVFLSYIGAAILGVKRVPNGKGGVLLSGRAYENVIGGGSKVPANLISGNTGIGVTLTTGTRMNLVFGNYIGLDRFGRPLPNTGRPVLNRGHRNVVRNNRT